MKRIDNHTLAILGRMEAEGNVLKLTCGQLDRKDYLKVDEILKAMGGQWNRKFGGHLFTEDPSDMLDQVLLTGEIARPQDFGFFPTPPELAQRVIDLAGLHPDDLVLEPSAGHGALAEAAAAVVGKARVRCVELLEQNVKVLQGKGFDPVAGDFLAMDPEPIYSAVVMNPPFQKQLDIDHVNHAWQFLKPGGRLVAIMSASVTFRTTRKTLTFRDLVAELGEMETNPEESFRQSGTLVATVTVVLGKPGVLMRETALPAEPVHEATLPQRAVVQDVPGLFDWYRAAS